MKKLFIKNVKVFKALNDELANQNSKATTIVNDGSEKH
jgi:hypothetical protein